MAEEVVGGEEKTLRSPICCIMGHVDYRENQCFEYKSKADAKLNVPGLLVIDTPGHEAFKNLRSRGSGLCDIAILVVDIMHGLEPQTIESLHLLRMRNTEFIIALNKVDRLYSWKTCHNAPIGKALKLQNKDVQHEFHHRVTQIITQFKEQGLNTELYNKNKDMGETYSIVPTSAIRNSVRFGDEIVVCGFQGPIHTTIRSLLTPHPMKELRVKGTLYGIRSMETLCLMVYAKLKMLVTVLPDPVKGAYIHHKEIKAAQGIKVTAQNLEHAVAGTALHVVRPSDDLDDIKESVMADMRNVMNRIDKSGEGVYVQASTLGSLEALLEFLKTPTVNIPVSGIGIGPVHKKDVMKAAAMLDKKKEFATILAFDVKVTPEAREIADGLDIKIFTADIIYHLFDQFKAYIENFKEEKKKEAAEDAVFPCVLQIMPHCVFNKKDPIILGVNVLEGILKIGTPICIPQRDFVNIGRISSIEKNKQQFDSARKGEQVAIKLTGSNPEEKQKMFGRHFEIEDELVSHISRDSINILKTNYRDELSNEDWKLLCKMIPRMDPRHGLSVYDLNRIQNLSLKCPNQKRNVGANVGADSGSMSLKPNPGKLPCYSPTAPCMCGGPMHHFDKPRREAWSLPDQKDVSDEEIEDGAKGKAKIGDEDLSKPFKEVLKCPFTRRIVEFSSPGHRLPANAKIYDGTGDSEDHIGRFVGIGNQGEWPMPVWCRMFQQTLDGKARAWFDKLPSGSIDNWGSLQEKFLNRFGMRKACDKDPTEISKIIHRPMKLSLISRKDGSHKCPELAKRFSDNVPKTVDEMLRRVDDYLRSEEAFCNTELPRGEFQRKDVPVQWVQRNDRQQRYPYGNSHRRQEHIPAFRAPERNVPYAPPQRPNQEARRPKPVLTLDSLSSTPQEILATEHQFRLPQPALLVGVPSKENINKYCDYHNEKGHNTNECFHLKQQLELALESGKLNHLVKDVRQKGRGGQRSNGPQKAKIINMVQCHSSDRKRKTTMTDERWMNMPIIFPPILARDLSKEALVVEAEVEGYLVRRTHIDEGASVEIMFEHCFNMLHPSIRSSGRCRRAILKFTVIPAPSPYNIILGHPGLKQLRAVPSTIHDMMKFPTPWGVATLISQTPVVFECRREGKKQAVEPPKERKAQDSVSLTDQVLVNPAYPKQLVAIEICLSPEGSNQLKNLLKENIDIFAWEPSDMTGVPKRIIKHSLNANPLEKPVSQKRRVFCSEKSQVITEEVAEWLKAGIVRPVKYPTWISNPVLVKKVDGSWRMCIDFKNINVACPKDYYPLPEIDSKIEVVMGFLLKCFLDAYKGYHQNAGATYQRLIDGAFQSQIGRNLEAYVDDMVIKSKSEREMLADIAETFDNLRRINMKLNQKKCSFGVEEGKFLGYMVTSEGIRANPAKTKDLAEMQSPRTWGEMQSLAGKLAALNRFLSWSAEKSLPFFETLKDITKENKHDYRWTEKAENAFQELKKMILDLPALTTPWPKETLCVYLAASKEAVSAVLLVVRQGKQHPVHYVSRTLHDAERNYAPLEKMALALRHASRQLRRYFEAHPITVITDQPIKQILSKADTSGRLAQYFVELGAYNIMYEPRSAIKGKILADFVNEMLVGGEAMVPRQTQYTIDH
ncbi:eukaryotic translation initiation factor 5B-like protein [Tanacetum coccineum]